MLQLTANQHSTPVIINPQHVSYVIDKHQGCVIVFSGGHSLHLSNSYNEVVGLLKAT